MFKDIREPKFLLGYVVVPLLVAILVAIPSYRAMLDDGPEAVPESPPAPANGTEPGTTTVPADPPAAAPGVDDASAAQRREVRLRHLETETLCSGRIDVTVNIQRPLGQVVLQTGEAEVTLRLGETRELSPGCGVKLDGFDTPLNGSVRAVLLAGRA